MKNDLGTSIFLGSLFSIILLTTAMTGALLVCVFSEVYGGDETEYAHNDDTAVDGFDPHQLPPPAAGAQEHYPEAPLSCEGVIYQVSREGIRHVRTAGGGIHYAAEVNNSFGIYMLDYGYLSRVDSSALDPGEFRKLKYALDKCRGPFVPSGNRFLNESPDKTRQAQSSDVIPTT